jgi:hypothetical protein
MRATETMHLGAERSPFVFDPRFDYTGAPARGFPGRYRSTVYRDRASWVRRCGRASQPPPYGELAA